jgi:hypothetical protein
LQQRAIVTVIKKTLRATQPFDDRRIPQSDVGNQAQGTLTRTRRVQRDVRDPEPNPDAASFVATLPYLLPATRVKQH